MNEPRTFREDVKPTIASSLQAKRLRRELTPPERRLWLRIKSKKLDGLHFRKQAPIGSYIADFYCHAARLVVEVDGGSHQGTQLIHDLKRGHWMEQQGICVIRFQASDVRDHLDSVLQRIGEVAKVQLQLREHCKYNR